MLGRSVLLPKTLENVVPPPPTSDADPRSTDFDTHVGNLGIMVVTGTDHVFILKVTHRPRELSLIRESTSLEALVTDVTSVDLPAPFFLARNSN